MTNDEKSSRPLSLVARPEGRFVIHVDTQYDVEYRPGMTVQDLSDALKFSFRMVVV